MVVPYAPGGAADPLARLVGERLASRLGQPVVAENNPGAGGNIGTNIVARAEPDGYTLMMIAASTMTINQSLYSKMPFDAIKDFSPIGLVALDSIIMVAHPALPIGSIQDLVALAKAKPGAINYASGGAGSGGHLAMELLKSMTGMNIVHVPFKSAGASITSLLAGDVSLTFTSSGSVLSLANDGKLKAIATATSKRLPNLPNLPTVDESGVPGYEVTGWYAVLAPAGTPQAIVLKLNAEIGQILEEAPVKDRISKMGLIPTVSTPDELGNIIKRDAEKWAGVVKEANIKID